MGDRHAFRAEWHDYNGGVYFVTICCRGMRHLFGSINKYEFHPSPLGALVDRHIRAIPERRDDVEIWNYVVMPNHLHLVLGVRTDAVQIEIEPTNMGCLRPSRHSRERDYFHHNAYLATVIGAFKAGVTRSARTCLGATQSVWQSRYHEHIIRTPRTLSMVLNYVANNVINWEKDCFYGLV